MNTKKNSERSILQAELKEINDRLKRIIDHKVMRTSELSNKEKKFLREMLQERDGDFYHYCHIPCGGDGMEFVRIWGKGCYGKMGKPDSGRKRLEIEHKNEYKDIENVKLRSEKLWAWDNLTLACPVCNIAKSDQFSEVEFQRVGKVMQEIWHAKEPKR